MKTLTIRNRFQSNTTMVENEFIDVHMIKANGEFVKVYLFLLRHLNNPCASVTISTIADCLEDTERDILRALKYWEAEGLLSIVYDEEHKIAGLELSTISSGTGPLPEIPEAVLKAVPSTQTVRETPPAKTKSSFKSKKEVKQLLFVAEQYLGKTLSKTDTDTISYFYDTLHFSTDLIEYLIEYCVENNHKSMHYIQSVALAWADANVQTIEDAKANSTMYNKNCYTVLKAFGITGRGPAANEKAYVTRWTDEYGFSLDLIQEACNRTMASIHQPSFDYTESILKNWSTKKVHHLADVEALDAARQRSKEQKQALVKPAKAPTKANNFQSRSYDYQSLEEQLLNQQAKEKIRVTQ